MDRRRFLSASVAVAAGHVLNGWSPARAQSGTKEIVVMTWGGQWGDALKESTDVLFTQQTGVKVLQDRASTPDQPDRPAARHA